MMMITDAKINGRNGGLAKKKKPEKRVYHAREVEFQLVQNEAGEWYLQFGGSESLFPATDVEVALWLRVKKEVSQEDAAVLNAIRQVRESTGFGRVVVEIKDGHVRLIEISSTVLVRRKDGTIEDEVAHEALNPGAV